MWCCAWAQKRREKQPFTRTHTNMHDQNKQTSCSLSHTHKIYMQTLTSADGLWMQCIWECRIIDERIHPSLMVRQSMLSITTQIEDPLHNFMAIFREFATCTAIIVHHFNISTFTSIDAVWTVCDASENIDSSITTLQQSLTICDFFLSGAVVMVFLILDGASGNWSSPKMIVSRQTLLFVQLW